MSYNIENYKEQGGKKWVVGANGELLVEGVNSFGKKTDGNYSEFESDGTLKFNGHATVWNDLPPNPIARSRTPASNNPTLTQFKGTIDQFTFAVNDYVADNFEILHEYKEGTDLVVHIHWTNNGTESIVKYVRWQFEYTIANAHSAFSDVVTLNTADIEIPADTPDRTHFVTNIGNISGENLKIGAVFSYNIKRVTATGTAPVANPFGLQVAPHIEIDTVGSRLIFTK